jgi:hypothetical protein
VGFRAHVFLSRGSARLKEDAEKVRKADPSRVEARLGMTKMNGLEAGSLSGASSSSFSAACGSRALTRIITQSAAFVERHCNIEGPELFVGVGASVAFGIFALSVASVANNM